MTVPVLRLTDRERRRIRGELDKIQAAVATSGSGQRGTSGGSVVRAALGKVGVQGRKALRQRTPKGTRPAVNRPRLRSAVYGKVHTYRRSGNLVYRVGWRRKLPGGELRFQQALAVEFGTRFMRAQRAVARTLGEIVGADGERFRRVFVEAMGARIQQLAAKANQQARR